MLTEDFDFEEQPKRKFELRDYQVRCIEAVEKGWEDYCRLLVDMATGTGKTSLFAAIAAEVSTKGGKVLVLENRDALVFQTAKRIREETGIEVDVEKAKLRGSPLAPVIVASVQTLGRTNRLLNWPDNHFDLVVVDEGHHSLAASYQKVLGYFHYGKVSIDEGWVAPDPESDYGYNANILSVTATPDLGNRRTLGEFYEHVAFQYQLIQAVNDGWLCRPITKNIPLKIDIRGLRPGRTPNGSDFKPEELSARMVPIIDALAAQIATIAADRKGIAFVPSIECARLLAEALCRHGLNGIFVSGACLDVDEKTQAFRDAGPGTYLCNAALYVEGADFPDISCVVCARATKSKGFYRQQVGRGTRVLPGVVDGLETPEERKLAIAMSAKPDLLILDPLWISDRIDLCDAYDLFTDDAGVKAKMKETGIEGMDLAELSKAAERDFIAALEKEARKHAKKEARTIDPLFFAVSIGDDALANWKPESAADLRPPTPGQIKFLYQQHVDMSQIKYAGMASKLIGRLITRMKLKLATFGQLSMMRQLGLDDATCSQLSIRDASALIGATLDNKKRNR